MVVQVVTVCRVLTLVVVEEQVPFIIRPIFLYLMHLLIQYLLVLVVLLLGLQVLMEHQEHNQYSQQ